MTGGLSWGRALERAAKSLQAAGIEGARRDARILLAAVMEVEPAQVMAYPERKLSQGQVAGYEGMLERRAAREPVSRILGRREFWGLEFRIGPHTLDPRPDSETLVSAILERIDVQKTPMRILDLGTGSGCLLLALLSELPLAEGVGIDIDAGALRVARENAIRLGLAGRARFAVCDWAKGLSGSWKVIVSNPPYIIGPEIDSLSPEVTKYDPRRALDAGPDGLSSYREIIPQAAKVLTPGGILVLELGLGQGDDVSKLLRQSGLETIERKFDLNGIERCLVARQAG